MEEDEGDKKQMDEKRAKTQCYSDFSCKGSSVFVAQFIDFCPGEMDDRLFDQ